MTRLNCYKVKVQRLDCYKIENTRIKSVTSQSQSDF